MTERKVAAIRELFAKTRNPHEIASQLDVKVADVRMVMRDTDLEELPGWGKVSLQPHIVSRRKANAAQWPTHDLQRLLDCRRLHDQGRVTMCQGRDGEWIIQYAVHSQRPLRRRPYFHGA